MLVIMVMMMMMIMMMMFFGKTSHQKNRPCSDEECYQQWWPVAGHKWSLQHSVVRCANPVVMLNVGLAHQEQVLHAEGLKHWCQHSMLVLEGDQVHQVHHAMALCICHA